VIGILIITLFGFNYFGKIIAENTEQYYVVSEECPESEQHTIYAIPIFYNQNAIVVTVNKENNKMIGGFKILDISGLSCAIKFKNIGVIND
jgi:ABC-type transporter MlaC component